MSLGSGKSDSYNLKKTPSPGINYDSLINDSSTNKFDADELENIRIYSPVDSQVHESFDIKKVLSENSFLKAQIEMLIKEKEMHVKSNAKDRIRINKEIQNVRNVMQEELIKVNEENKNLMQKNTECLKKIQKLQSFKNEKIEFYKRQLESQEKHYEILINDKNRVISSLKKHIDDKKSAKTLRIKSKKLHSKKWSSIGSKAVSPKLSTLNFYVSPKRKLDDITGLIVKLEKQQAELKETTSDLDLGPYNHVKKSSEPNPIVPKSKTQYLKHHFSGNY